MLSENLFPAIVASGANSAIPHHVSGQTLISPGVLLLDMGHTVDGYCSDFTRTLRVEGPEENKTQKAEFERMLAIVRAAQRSAIDMVQPGIGAGEIDRAAREYIAQTGYGEFFSHSTGHGVGLAIHELPHVSASVDTMLESGMVITVEPGIYLPGEFGVRREDIVIVE
ncbi:MAG: M24 family metallopeptidase [Candidatus Peribacteria bacterium]|nr:MAG: M24 family metallopeptidase [Candidatus Peribacteria bacterium]